MKGNRTCWGAPRGDGSTKAADEWSVMNEVNKIWQQSIKLRWEEREEMTGTIDWCHAVANEQRHRKKGNAVVIGRMKRTWAEWQRYQHKKWWIMVNEHRLWMSNVRTWKYNGEKNDAIRRSRGERSNRLINFLLLTLTRSTNIKFSASGFSAFRSWTTRRSGTTTTGCSHSNSNSRYRCTLR